MPSSGDWKQRSTLLAWLCVAFWAAVVMGLGSDPFSHSTTSRYLLPMLRWLLPEAEPRVHLLLAQWIRKAAHVVEYAVLGALSYRALRLSTRFGWAGLLCISTLLVAGLAAADEGRQFFSTARSGRLHDVGLDLLGGVSGGALFAWWSARRPRAEPSDRLEDSMRNGP